MSRMTYADVARLREARRWSRAEEREIDAFLAKRKAKAEALKRGRIESANNAYKAGSADVANAKKLLLELAERVRTGRTSLADGQAMLARLRAAYAAGREQAESAAATIAEIGAADPVELYERDRTRIPALASRVGDDEPPAFLSQP